MLLSILPGSENIPFSFGAGVLMIPHQQMSRSLQPLCPRLVAFACHVERANAVASSSTRRTIGVPCAQSSHMHTTGISTTGVHGRRRPESGGEGESRRLSSFESLKQKQLIVDKVLTHVKHRIPQKRASNLMSQLREEAKKAPPVEIPDITSGDAVEIKMYESKSSKVTHVTRGVVLRKVNRGVDTSVLLRDIVYDVDVEHHVPLYNPLIQSMEVLEKGFIHQGKKRGKRVRQSRIYYLRGIHEKFSRVTGGRF